MIPHAVTGVGAVALPHGLPRAEFPRQVPPRNPSPVPVDHPVDDASIVLKRAALTALIRRQQRLNTSPLLIRQRLKTVLLITHSPSLPRASPHIKETHPSSPTIDRCPCGVRASRTDSWCVGGASRTSAGSGRTSCGCAILHKDSECPDHPNHRVVVSQYRLDAVDSRAGHLDLSFHHLGDAPLDNLYLDGAVTVCATVFVCDLAAGRRAVDTRPARRLHVLKLTEEHDEALFHRPLSRPSRVVALDGEVLVKHAAVQSGDRRSGLDEFGFVAGFEGGEPSLVAGIEVRLGDVVAFGGPCSSVSLLRHRREWRILDLPDVWPLRRRTGWSLVDDLAWCHRSEPENLFRYELGVVPKCLRKFSRNVTALEKPHDWATLSMFHVVASSNRRASPNLAASTQRAGVVPIDSVKRRVKLRALMLA